MNMKDVIVIGAGNSHVRVLQLLKESGIGIATVKTESNPFNSNNFVNNDENGPFREYYKNGNIKAEGTYINGPNEQGELKEYNEDGELIKIMSCTNGICNTIWVK